jgi:hypothetical protein
VGKHTWLKTYPTNPTRGVKGGKTAVLDGANLCRVGYPTPTRHYPTTPAFGRGRVGKHTWLKTYPTNPTRGVKGGKTAVLDGANLCRVGYPTPTRHYPTTPAFGRGRVGKHTWLKTYPTNPTRGVKGGKTAVLEGANLCRVGYPTPTRHYPTPPDTATLCRVVSGGCRGIHPTRVFAIRNGINPSLRGTCRVCRVGFQGGL